MTSRSSRGRRRSAMLAVATLAAAFAVGIVEFACGFDGEATKDFPAVVPDATTPLEASVVPRPDSGAGEASVPDATVDGATPATCPAGHGTMVLVDAGGLVFCIDSTEVSNAEYDKFLAAIDGGAVDAGVLDGSATDGCAGNATFTRGAGGPAFPVSSVDWCDAHAYCEWAGKRLCGKTVAGDASTGEWYAACTNGGTRKFPYGDDYDASACNASSGSASAVGSYPGCQGGVPGLFDMNGNVTELIDSCSSGSCLSMGGFYYLGFSRCEVVNEYSKSATDPAIGFRCCGDLH